MSNLQASLTFIDDGRDNREKENFQSFLFKDIDMRKREHPISFQRSDFRGAAFRSSFFLRNNFGNGDFIDSTVIQTTFDDCIFRHSEIHNTYFDKTTLRGTLFSSASFIDSVFTDCTIDSSKFNVNTLKECKFYNCKIIDSKFDRCSIDGIEFSRTHFENCDLSGNTAINLYFSDCTFNGVVIDGDYIGSYFFKGEFLDKLRMKYRGKIVNIDFTTLEILKNLFGIFLDRSRYYEALNILVQVGMIEKKPSSIFKPCEVILNKLFSEANGLRRQYQLEKIFKLFEYYINTEYIVIDDYFKLIAYFEKLNIPAFSLEEQLFLIGKISRLKSLLNIVDLESGFIESISPTEKVLLEIKIDEKDKIPFLNLFDRLTTRRQKELQLSETPYEILGFRKGSLLIDIVLYASTALFLMKLLRKILKETRLLVNDTSGLITDVKMGFDFHTSLNNTKALKLHAVTNKTVRDIQKSTTLAINSSKDSESDDAKQLLPLLKSFVIYPNALSNSEK